MLELFFSELIIVTSIKRQGRRKRESSFGSVCLVSFFIRLFICNCRFLDCWNILFLSLTGRCRRDLHP